MMVKVNDASLHAATTSFVPFTNLPRERTKTKPPRNLGGIPHLINYFLEPTDTFSPQP